MQKVSLMAFPQLQGYFMTLLDSPAPAHTCGLDLTSEAALSLSCGPSDSIPMVLTFSLYVEKIKQRKQIQIGAYGLFL